MGGLCRSPYLWKDPDTFRPERFSETNSNPDFKGAWAGYRPEAQGSSVYPNEVLSTSCHLLPVQHLLSYCSEA